MKVVALQVSWKQNSYSIHVLRKLIYPYDKKGKYISITHHTKNICPMWFKDVNMKKKTFQCLKKIIFILTAGKGFEIYMQRYLS